MPNALSAENTLDKPHIGSYHSLYEFDHHPALTTVRIDGTAIGRQAARFILDWMNGVKPVARVRDIGFSIVERASA